MKKYSLTLISVLLVLFQVLACTTVFAQEGTYQKDIGSGVTAEVKTFKVPSDLFKPSQARVEQMKKEAAQHNRPYQEHTPYAIYRSEYALITRGTTNKLWTGDNWFSPPHLSPPPSTSFRVMDAIRFKQEYMVLINADKITYTVSATITNNNISNPAVSKVNLPRFCDPFLNLAVEGKFIPNPNNLEIEIKDKKGKVEMYYYTNGLWKVSNSMKGGSPDSGK